MRDTVLEKTLLESKKTNYPEGVSLLRQAYETTFGIHDYFQQEANESVLTDPLQKRPLTSIAFHNVEDVSTYSSLYEMIRVFRDRKVYSIFGLSLKDFLDMPPDICDHILTLCSEQQKVDNKINTDIMAGFNIQKK